MVLLGAYSANTTVAVFSTTGVILGCAYSLWLMNRILLEIRKFIHYQWVLI
jgi:NADH:ubiquinone oxidoreductase subunit 4 (subunit M)